MSINYTGPIINNCFITIELKKHINEHTEEELDEIKEYLLFFKRRISRRKTKLNASKKVQIK